MRSREGLRAVAVSLAVLLATALAQAAVYASSGSVALLADLIHNAGDAMTAIPLGIAFVLRSPVAERRAGYAVVAAILVSAGVAGAEAVDRLLHPQSLTTSGSWPSRAWSGSSATRSPPGCGSAPAAGCAARRWSPTATTPAATRSSRWPSSPAPRSWRSASRSATRSSASSSPW